MGIDGFPIDIIIFAAIAAFIVLRLRNVLGRRTGSERPPPVSTGGNARRPQGEPDKVVNFPEQSGRKADVDLAFDRAEPGTALHLGLSQIKKADKAFNADEFLKGAAMAFEMIIQAFADGKMDGVKPYLSKDVYQNFANAIKGRSETGELLDTTVVGIKKSDILEARMEGRTALVTAKFVSEQINVTRDKNGAVLDGDPDRITEVSDIWTFSRDTQSRDPNWILVETRSPN